MDAADVVGVNPRRLESLFAIGHARPFLITSASEASAESLLEVHVSSAVAPIGYASRLRRKLAEHGFARRVRVRRHGGRSYWRSRSLQDFLQPFGAAPAVLDPTGAVGRGRRLVAVADGLRSSLGEGVRGVYWEPVWSALYVVFERSRYVHDGLLRVPDLRALEREVRALLRDIAGPDATDFIKAVRLGFDIPAGSFVPVDSASIAKRPARGQAVRRWWKNSSLALLLGAAIPGAATAQQSAPAVSGPNWDIGLSGGSRDGDGAVVFDGMYTAPLSYTTGFRIDGAAGSTEDGFLGGAAFHYFSRNPQVGLLGGFVSYATADPNDGVDDQQDLVRVAGESEIYFGNLTVLGIAGAQFSDDIDEGFFGRLNLEWYATDDLMFSVGGEYDPQREGALTAGVEWQPGYLAMPGLTFFAEGAVGNDDFEQVLAGARIYFGAPKSLKDRHRYDTFRDDNEGLNSTLPIGVKQVSDDGEKKKEEENQSYSPSPPVT